MGEPDNKYFNLKWLYVWHRLAAKTSKEVINCLCSEKFEQTGPNFKAFKIFRFSSRQKNPANIASTSFVRLNLAQLHFALLLTTLCLTTIYATTLCPTKCCLTTIYPTTYTLTKHGLTTIYPTTLCLTTLCLTTLCLTTLCLTTLCLTTLCPTTLCQTRYFPNYTLPNYFSNYVHHVWLTFARVHLARRLTLSPTTECALYFDYWYIHAFSPIGCWWHCRRHEDVS
jgi:hypothetical protein